MSHKADDFLRDLMKIWDSTASDDEQTSVNFFLLSIMRKEGVKGVVALIQGLDQTQLGEVEIIESGSEAVIKMVRSGIEPLVLKAGDDDLSPWVDIQVESETSLTTPEDPRHAAFYAIWERLLGTEQNSSNPRSVEENAVYLMALLEAEVMNGGIGQYLSNTEGLHLPETFKCLEQIGATKTHAVLTNAVELASGFDSFVDAWDEESEAYSSLDTEFLESSEDLAALTADGFLE